MSTPARKLRKGHRVTCKSTSDSKFNAPLSVPVDTLFSIQISALLTSAHREMECHSVEFNLNTRTEAALGSHPFQSSKKVMDFNGARRQGQILCFESSHSNFNRFQDDSTSLQQVRLEIENALGAVGELVVSTASPEEHHIGCLNLKRHIEQLVIRTVTQEKVKRWFGESNLWCGISKSIQFVEHQLAEFASSNQPILIKGNRSSGKKYAALFAAAVHNSDKPSFIELPVNKSDSLLSAAEIESAYQNCQRGTLYIRNVDALGREAQATLRRLCESELGETRLIIALPSGKNPSHPLNVWLEYHCHNVTLPSFEERKSDVRFMCQQYLFESCKASCELNNEIYSALMAEKSCNSIAVLHSLLDKLQHEKNPDKEFVERLCQSLSNATGSQVAKTVGATTNGAQRNSLHGAQQGTQQGAQQDGHKDLVIPLGKLYSSRFSETLEPSQEHPAILKALTYLAEHYQESFSLQDLADQAFVSPSHLSYLLKNRFGKSFKGLLIEFRIEKAQEILKEFPIRQITQVCIDVGFLDLSHFEKTFKKVTGFTPRRYREQHKQRLSISAQ